MSIFQRRPAQPQLGRTSQPQPIPAAPSFSKLVAAAIWLLACITSYQLVAALTPGMDSRYQMGVAVFSQVLLTWMERPVLRGKPNKISGMALLIDTLINAGGAFPFALRISATPTAQMISAALNIPNETTPLAAMFIALIAGFLLAAAPEGVWRWRE